MLLAYELNGAPLPAEHGFPVRLVVPGYYGTNSVKWLWRLHLAGHRAEGPFTTEFYNDRLGADDVAAGLPSRRPVWALAPESIIVAPAPDTVVAAGELTEIWGWAWSYRGIAAAEVSVDGGASFTRATLEQRSGWAWQRFSLPWRPSRSRRGAAQRSRARGRRRRPAARRRAQCDPHRADRRAVTREFRNFATAYLLLRRCANAGPTRPLSRPDQYSRES